MDLLSTVKDEVSFGKVIIEQVMELSPFNFNDRSRLFSISYYISTGFTRNDFDRLFSFILAWVQESLFFVYHE
jgi:hypothetical protein